MFLIKKALLSFPELFKQEINKIKLFITKFVQQNFQKKHDAGDVDWEGESKKLNTWKFYHFKKRSLKPIDIPRSTSY